jgi:uncharacterized phage-associated protein
MNHDGRAVANFVLDRCDLKGRHVTNLALQKIVYFCHAWSLAVLKKPLIKHQFEAWKHGPVLQYLYRDFKDFDKSPITWRAKKLNSATGDLETVAYRFDTEEQDFLERVIDFYSCIRPGTLVELSHTAGGPWEVVWNHGEDVNPGMKIENEKISEFFSRRNPPF